MAGVGEAASVVSLISFSIQLFDGCVKGFVLLSAAQELGSRGDVLKCQFEWEHYRLNDWATTVGLFREPPELNVPYPPIVQTTLANLEQLLTDASKLKKDYGLDVIVTDEEIKNVQAPKSIFGRAFGKSKPQFVNDTAKVYSRRNSVWRKLKWGAVDAEKLRLLLKDIRYFNKQLQSLLHSVERIRTCTGDNALVRYVVSQTSDTTLLNAVAEPLDTVDAAIAASARLKRQGLMLELVESTPHSISSFQTSASSSQTTLVPPLSHKRRSSPAGKARILPRSPDLLSDCRGTTTLAVTREIAQYDGNAIVVEWKSVDRALESKLKHRIANVAALLGEMQDPSFHSLHCFGYLKAHQSGRYAYLFRPPAAWPSTFSMKSLQDLYSSYRPSLNCRIAVAVNLVETVLQLHTSGWLHKCIRPDNLLFFKPKTQDWDKHEDLPPAYLGGYEYARADNPLETTEAPSAQRHSELYRHPLSIGQGRRSFIKAFDLYSLGCVLLELAYWLPLQSILLKYLRRERSRTINAPEATSPISPRDDAEYFSMLSERQRLLEESGPGTMRGDVCYLMGTAYEGIVNKCLHGSLRQINGDDEDLDDGLEVQEESLSVLKSLAPVI